MSYRLTVGGLTGDPAELAAGLPGQFEAQPNGVEGHWTLHLEATDSEAALAALIARIVASGGQVRDVHILSNTIAPAAARIAAIRVAKGTDAVVIHGNDIEAEPDSAIVIEGERSAVRLQPPETPLAVGPDSAPEDAARHLRSEPGR